MHDPVIDMMLTEKVGCNTICKECRADGGKMTNALGPWLTCDPSLSAQSILFVGKVARGDSMGEEIADQLEDVRCLGADFIRNSSWPYYSYTREIITSVFGTLEIGLPYVSFTNIVKCNNESTNDTTPWHTKEFCINKNAFIWKEVEVIKPKIIVFYTHTNYDVFIDAFMPSYARSFKDGEETAIEIGQKTMPWWERTYFDETEKLVLTILRVGHPERKKKEDFTSLVADWIKSKI